MFEGLLRDRIQPFGCQSIEDGDLSNCIDNLSSRGPPLHDISSISALASFRSVVSKPSVNQS